ncbi:MAG: hypothetical protein KDD44_13290, partial [Bdellovibrionales bacterium]|nr:hypothetical protein [Bdellovibrionales bacterium]
MLTQPFTKLLQASLVVAILGLATATSVAAESDDANLCSCFGKKVSRYVHYDDTKRLHLFNVLRCAECDLYQQLDAAERQKLVDTTPTDDATIGALRAHLRWLERTYPRQIAQLLHGILTRIVHDDGSELQRFDSCFFSQFAAALASPRPRHPADGPLVDCDTPAHALVVDVNDIESVLLISVG